MPVRKAIKSLLLMVAVLGNHPFASADNTPDYARETRIAEQIEPQVFDGEVVWLNDGQRDFLSIYSVAESSQGSVIVLHGRDVNPEDLNVAGPVRVALAEEGWSTLAIQLPVLAKGKTYFDYLPILDLAAPRIEAAIAFLRSQGTSTVVIAAHSCGAHMANQWLNRVGDNAIDGYIAMGLGATDKDQELRTPFPIGNMHVPVLDVSGANEFPGALALVEKRRQLLEENGNPGSIQIVITDTNHYFADAGDRLSEQLADWLTTTDFTVRSSGAN